MFFLCTSVPPNPPAKIKNIKRLERDLKFKKTKCRPGNGSVRTKTPVSAFSPMRPKNRLHILVLFFFPAAPTTTTTTPHPHLSQSLRLKSGAPPSARRHLSVPFLGLLGRLLPVGGAAVASAGTVVGYVHIHGRSMASTKPQDYFRRSNTHTCRREASVEGGDGQKRV